MKIVVNGKILQVDETTIFLPCEIDPSFANRNVLKHKGKIFVNFFPGSDAYIAESRKLPNQNRNIWCFDLQGEKLWEIEEQTIAYASDQNRRFSSLRINEGKVIAYNVVGFDFEVDLDTGKIQRYPPGCTARPW